MAKESTRRKKVVRLMVVFVAALALLTFFSNTIMNLTIPKVMGTYPSRGNISYSNSAKGEVVVENQTKIQGLEGRVVDAVKVSNYDIVQKGDTIVTLKSIEDSEELESKKTELTELEREAEYEQRGTTSTDFSSYYDMIDTAKTNLSEAKDTLSMVQNKASVEAENQQIIDDESANAVSLEATVNAAAGTVEDIQKQIDEIDSNIAPLQSQVDVYVALGTPTPTPTPAPGEPGYVEPDPSYIPDLDPDGIDRNSPTYEMDKLLFKIKQYEEEKDKLEEQLASAQARLDEASADLAECQGKIDEAQAEIDALKDLPSEAQASNAVSSAQNALNSAQKSLSDAQTQDGIDKDRAEDATEDRNKKIEKLKMEIEDLEKQSKITAITAPVAGYIYNVTVSSGDTLTAKDVITCIIPESNRVCSVTFRFDTSVAQGIFVGMDLTVTSGYIESCTVVGIKPDPDNPRGSRLVKCSIDDENAWPDEEITVNAGRGNDNYTCVVPSGAVCEDNSGSFVYTIVGSSSPLGDKYIVKRVDVRVLATDGASTAVEGEGLDKYEFMIVVRSEKPLENGQRVRLEDFSAK